MQGKDDVDDSDDEGYEEAGGAVFSSSTRRGGNGGASSSSSSTTRTLFSIAIFVTAVLTGYVWLVHYITNRDQLHAMEVQPALTALEKSLAHLEEEIHSLSTELDKNKEESSALAQQLAKSKKDYNSLSEEYQKTKKEFTTLKTDVGEKGKERKADDCIASEVVVLCCTQFQDIDDGASSCLSVIRVVENR